MAKRMLTCLTAAFGLLFLVAPAAQAEASVRITSVGCVSHLSGDEGASDTTVDVEFNGSDFPRNTDVVATGNITYTDGTVIGKGSQTYTARKVDSTDGSGEFSWTSNFTGGWTKYRPDVEIAMTFKVGLNSVLAEGTYLDVNCFRSGG